MSKKRLMIKIAKSLLVFWLFVALIALVITIFREGYTLPDSICPNCITAGDCKERCEYKCADTLHYSETAEGYIDEHGNVRCDCRCDHFLNKVFFKAKCGNSMTYFGNSCCSDIDGDSICDKYTIGDLEKREKLAAMKADCIEICEDNNPCTEDFCLAETKYTCEHKLVAQCCGNNACEESESCVNCLRDCGSCMSIEALKLAINSVLGEGSWRSRADVVDRDIVYNSFPYGNVVVAQIKNEEKFMHDYNDFLGLNFRYVEEQFPGEVWKEKILEKKNWNTVIGKINEKLGYWKNDEDGRKELFHSFNVFCSPDMYVRIEPEWSYKKLKTYDDYNELARIHQFDVETEEMLPVAYEILENCYFSAKKDCENCYHLFDLIQDIIYLFGKDYLFLVHSSDNETDRYAPFQTEDIVINSLKKKIGTGDFFNFTFYQFDFSRAWITNETERFTSSLKNRTRLTQKAFIRYKRYLNHTVNRTVFYDQISEIEGSERILETLYGVLDHYKITYNSTAVDGSFINFYFEDERRNYITHKVSVLCGNSFVVDLYANVKENAEGPDDSTIISNIQHEVELTRQKLLEDAERLAIVCNR